MIDKPKGRNPSVTPIYQARKNMLTYLDRIDPLYEVTWRDGVNMDWSEIHSVRHELRISANGQLIHVNAAISSPIDISSGITHSHHAIRSMAALIQFYQLSTYQIATHLGTTPNRVWKSLSALYSYGAIERAIPHWIKENIASDRGDAGSGSLWRINTRSPRLETWLSKLKPLEYMLLTGGNDITKGTNSSRSATSVRHNFAAAEIMTRVMEVVPGALGVWGESFTIADKLIDTDLRHSSGIRLNIADGVIVTKDGKLILIETSGASKLDNALNGQRIQAKASAWATVAALSDLDIRVIFVDISQSPSPKRFRYHVQQGVESADKFMSNTRMRERGKEAIFLADSHDWFPFELSISKGFETLEAWSPITERYHDLVPIDTKLDKDSDVVINTIGSIHTPKWALGNVYQMATTN